MFVRLLAVGKDLSLGLDTPGVSKYVGQFEHPVERAVVVGNGKMLQEP